MSAAAPLRSFSVLVGKRSAHPPLPHPSTLSSTSTWAVPVLVWNRTNRSPSSVPSMSNRSFLTVVFWAILTVFVVLILQGWVMLDDEKLQPRVPRPVVSSD